MTELPGSPAGADVLADGKADFQRLLGLAQLAMRHGQWRMAQVHLTHALQWAPNSAPLHHTLASCHLEQGDAHTAVLNARRALLIDARFWQAHILEGNALKALARHEEADAAFARSLQMAPGNGEALLARADLAMNIFGQPLQAIELVRPLLKDTQHGVDAQLTLLMANVYDRDVSASALSASVKLFSRQNLRLDTPITPAQIGSIPRRSGPSGLRPRVALISPLLCASPVYFLTIAGWRHVAKGSDIIVFNRGRKSDWATQELKALAREWHEVPSLSSESLAKRIHLADIDVLYDLGGWMDPVALRALSVKPAHQMFKWVGGQSLTTGLDAFDGWIGDQWQSPLTLQHLYTEPLVNIPNGYATYTAPPYLPNAPMHKRSEPIIFSNPAKLSRQFLTWLSQTDGPVIFLHKQFKYERTREKILRALGRSRVRFVCPTHHREALEILGQHEWMIDTFPYSSGLTAREAQAMGVKVKVVHSGELFCERHSLHLKLSSEKT
jgi:protein O-GlcNAc transferase